MLIFLPQPRSKPPRPSCSSLPKPEKQARTALLRECRGSGDQSGGNRPQERRRPVGIQHRSDRTEHQDGRASPLGPDHSCRTAGNGQIRSGNEYRLSCRNHDEDRRDSRAGGLLLARNVGRTAGNANSQREGADRSNSIRQGQLSSEEFDRLIEASDALSTAPSS